MWKGCKGKREGDSIGVQERGRREGNTCEAAIVFLGLFLLRLDPIKPPKNRTLPYLNEIPFHCIHEIRTKRYDVIGVTEILPQENS